MKKQLTKKLMAVVVAVICCATSVISACAVSANDIYCSTDCHYAGNSRLFFCGTALPYTCTWVRVTSSAQKYPSGSALLSGLSETKNNSDVVVQLRFADNYTGKMTVYGAHSMYIGGKAYIRYSTTPNA